MMCQACELGDHANCGLQIWCECDCDPEADYDYIEYPGDDLGDSDFEGDE